MANITDVAERAKVSAMTVSRVINNSGYVKEETRRRVVEAMQALNFHPNYLARSLVEQKTNTLCLIVPDITNPFYTTVARGTEDAARKRGYRVILCNSDESLEKEQEYIDMALSIRVDGLVIVSAGDESAENLQRFMRHNIPLVLLDREVPGVEADLVTGDNVFGAEFLVTHLLSLGHRHIAFLSGQLSISTSRERLLGYRISLEAAGLPFQPEYVLETTYMRSSKTDMVDRLLALPNQPTAIFAGNNFIATSIIQELRRRKLRIPDDMAVVSFDDVDPLSLADPFLTVAMQPSYESGSIATTMLLDRLDAKPDAPRMGARKVTMKPDFFVRKSSIGDSGTEDI